MNMKGEETEIDRNMVEEIYEPLVHMIRNSVDHGIEMPEERVQAGKDPTGTILIAAEQKGGNIVIDIEDDGQGLTSKRIREKAIERGIISASDQLDENAIFDLIFHPGFSTKDKVTEVSGRGVGMDVVKKCVERLRGKMEIIEPVRQGIFLSHETSAHDGHHRRDDHTNRGRTVYRADNFSQGIPQAVEGSIFYRSGQWRTG